MRSVGLPRPVLRVVAGLCSGARLAGLVAALAGPVAADAIDTPSRWIGAVDTRSARFAWPGSGFQIRFSGTWLDLSLTDNGKNSLMVLRDGLAERLDLKKGSHSYRIASGLGPGPHAVSVLRRTEGLFGPTKFISAETDGTFLEALAPDRQILVIGDSISAGYGVEGTSSSCKFSADTENQFRTFAAIAGRTFGADVSTLAVSGKGLVRNVDGSTTATMPELIYRTLPLAEATRRDRMPVAAAGAVIVHLGTNDFAQGNRPESFGDSYERFLGELRDRFPEAMIYAAIGPSMPPKDYDAALSAITRAVEGRVGAGDRRVRTLAFPRGEGDFGCNFHPNEAAHARMAETLAAALAGDLGWTAP